MIYLDKWLAYQHQSYFVMNDLSMPEHRNVLEHLCDQHFLILATIGEY